MEKVFVTGGAGYVGCVLTPKLLEAGYEVIVYDLMLFGSEGLDGIQSPNLKVVNGDLRDTQRLKEELAGADHVLHLACISNDPSFELNPEISKSINYDCFEPLVKTSKDAGVKRFIYVSSSSVYGVSEAPDVTEEHPLVPLTDYNKYKGMCEPILFEYDSPDFVTSIIRPATVSGYSPRMRLDLSVNILTNHAVNKGKITVFGGTQRRPNIHIEDVCELYVKLLKYPAEKISGEIFNANEGNYAMMKIAEIVKTVVQEEFPERGEIPIERTETDDIRSYHVNSGKLEKVLGFKAERNVADAARDLCQAFKQGLLPASLEDEKYFNVKTVKGLNLV